MRQNKHLLETAHSQCINYTLLGWYKESIIYDVSGIDWQIATYKWGGAIRCCAKMGFASEQEGCLFIPANRPLLRLHTEYRYVDKDAVIDVHEKGTKRFDHIVASGLILVPQHIKQWVQNEKYRTAINKYGRKESYKYRQSNTHF